MIEHVFIRHIRLTDVDGICYGHTDWPVNIEHCQQAARQLAPLLPNLPIVSSTQVRCIELAKSLCDILNKDRFSSDSSLLEMNFGQWESLPWASIDRRLIDQWANDVVGFAPPAGESFAQLIERVRGFLIGLDQPHIIVTHAGVIRAAQHVLAAMPVEQAAMIEVPYAQPIRLPIIAESVKTVTPDHY